MGREPEFHFEFPRRFEIEILERLRPRQGYSRALGFPGGFDLDPQQELSDEPIVGVHPDQGEPWIGTFAYSQGGHAPAPRTRIIGMPDAISFCVVKHGSAYLVRADDPALNTEIDCYPVQDVLVAADQGLVVFADSVSLLAYGEGGELWRTERFAWDDLELLGSEGHVLKLSGFDAPANASREFKVDLRTGRATEQPYR